MNLKPNKHKIISFITQQPCHGIIGVHTPPPPLKFQVPPEIYLHPKFNFLLRPPPSTKIRGLLPWQPNIYVHQGRKYQLISTSYRGDKIWYHCKLETTSMVYFTKSFIFSVKWPSFGNKLYFHKKRKSLGHSMSNDQRLPACDSSRISSFLEIWFISMRNENTENLRSFAQLGSSQNITV